MDAFDVREGDTVWLQGDFKDDDGNYTDPTSASLIILNAFRSAITTVSLASLTKTSIGRYEYPYTIPSGHRYLYFKYVGVVETYNEVEEGQLNVIGG